MHKKLPGFIKPLFKTLLAVVLVVVLAFGQADGALAAVRGGGRIGGGSFRMPSSSYGAPSRTYTAPRGGYYPGGGYPGGGFGFPFVFPPMFFIGGGGGLFTILIFIAIAGFLTRALRRPSDSVDAMGYSTPTVSIAEIQVGLLSSARELQVDLDRIARTANTGSSAGLTQVLQETTLSLLRHPEYWVYAGSKTQQARLEAAEAQFNRLSLAERSKFSGETLSNVNSQLKQAEARAALPEAGGSLASPGEYIVVTLLVAAQGNLQLPAVQNTEDVRRALSQVGAVSSDKLLALEVLWTPQAEGDTLSADEMIAEYPDLKLI
jgi:uncharacterized membrane protein